MRLMLSVGYLQKCTGLTPLWLAGCLAGAIRASGPVGRQGTGQGASKGGERGGGGG